MPRRTLLIWTAALTLTIIAACLDAKSRPEETRSIVQDLQSCSSNCDCTSNLAPVCREGTCQGAFGPFPPGGYCAARDCTPGQPCTIACANSCDCLYGSACGSDGVCHDDFGPFPECYCGTRDCSSGVCNGNICTGGGGGGGGHGSDENGF
jgi:hypothetical protein